MTRRIIDLELSFDERVKGAEAERLRQAAGTDSNKLAIPAYIGIRTHWKFYGVSDTLEEIVSSEEFTEQTIQWMIDTMREWVHEDDKMSSFLTTILCNEYKRDESGNDFLGAEILEAIQNMPDFD